MAPDDSPDVVTFRVSQIETRLDRLESSITENTKLTQTVKTFLDNGQRLREVRVKRWRWAIGTGFAVITATQPIIYRALGL